MKTKMSETENQLEARVITALKNVFDPEIPVNIYDLGLVYELKIDENANVSITMTLTAPNCPIAEDMPGIVMEEVKKVEGVGDVNVELTFEPPWDQTRISKEAMLDLGLI
jgi:FeS assembly SUF system protein